MAATPSWSGFVEKAKHLQDHIAEVRKMGIFGGSRPKNIKNQIFLGNTCFEGSANKEKKRK